MIALFKWIFASKERFATIFLSLTLIAVCVYICYLKLNIASLEKTILEQSQTIATQQADINAAKATLDGERAVENMCKADTASINNLLNQCYAALAKYESDFAEIEENMEAGQSDQPIHNREVYDVITRAQQESGASYINRQFDDLK